MPKYPIQRPRPPFPPPTPPPIRIEGKATKEALDAMRARIASIPGVETLVIGGAVKIRIRANSYGEMAQKIQQLPDEIKWAQSKTMCDGEPVRIT